MRNTVPALAETLPLGGSRPGGHNLRDRTGLNLPGNASARDSLLKLSIACIGKILVSGGDRTPPHICREALCLGRLLSKVEIVQVAFAKMCSLVEKCVSGLCLICCPVLLLIVKGFGQPRDGHFCVRLCVWEQHNVMEKTWIWCGVGWPRRVYAPRH